MVKWSSRAQQEMVGFVLIVIIVIIGLFVFLLFSVRDTQPQLSPLSENILTSVLRTTSRCALVYEPNYDDMRDLIRSCYENKRCRNTNELACSVLEESVEGMLDEVMQLEPYISAYQFDLVHENSQGFDTFYHLVKGECNSTVYGAAPRKIEIPGEGVLWAEFRICVDSDL